MLHNAYRLALLLLLCGCGGDPQAVSSAADAAERTQFLPPAAAPGDDLVLPEYVHELERLLGAVSIAPGPPVGNAVRPLIELRRTTGAGNSAERVNLRWI